MYSSLLINRFSYILAPPSQAGRYQYQDPLKSEESELAIEELLLDMPSMHALIYSLVEKKFSMKNIDKAC